MPSFDVVSEVDKHNLTNAIDQTQRLITNRFDFKGVNATFERKEYEITMGFDRPTQSTFFQVFDLQDEDFIADESTHGSLKEALTSIGMTQAAMEDLIQPMARTVMAEALAFSVNPAQTFNIAVRYDTATV